MNSCKLTIRCKKSIVVKIFLFYIFSSLCLFTWAQNTIYTPLYNSGNFTKTVDLSKPVAEVVGSANVSGTGGVLYSIPIFTPPGTNDLQPTVSLNYSSQSGSGIAGYGWNISGVSVISRAGKNMFHNGEVQAIKFTASDDAFLLDGMRLNVISGTNGANGAVYPGESETYSKIESFTTGSANNPNWFSYTGMKCCPLLT